MNKRRCDGIPAVIIEQQGAFHFKKTIDDVGMSFHIFCEQSTSCFYFFIVIRELVAVKLKMF